MRGSYISQLEASDGVTVYKILKIKKCNNMEGARKTNITVVTDER